MKVKDVIAKGGGVTRLASTLGLKRTAVQMWNRDGYVPAKHAMAVSRALDVRVEDILPPAPIHQVQDQAA